MVTPAAGLVRVVRAGVLAAVMLGLASVAHVAGGDSLPSGPALGLLAALVAGECAVVTRWRLSPVTIAALLGGGQFLLHQAFMALAMPVSVSAGPLPSGHHAMTGSTLVPVTAGGATHTVPLMLLAHAIAVLLLAGLLAFGESALWLLWCWLAPATLRTGRAPMPVPRVTLPVRPDRAPEPGRLLLLAADPRRGPPVPAVG